MLMILALLACSSPDVQTLTSSLPTIETELIGWQFIEHNDNVSGSSIARYYSSEVIVEHLCYGNGVAAPWISESITVYVKLQPLDRVHALVYKDIYNVERTVTPDVVTYAKSDYDEYSTAKLLFYSASSLYDADRNLRVMYATPWVSLKMLECLQQVVPAVVSDDKPTAANVLGRPYSAADGLRCANNVPPTDYALQVKTVDVTRFSTAMQHNMRNCSAYENTRNSALFTR